MALPTSGEISLSQIQTEFGGSNPIGLDEYYGVASGLPTSGQISMSQFYGLSNGYTLTVGQSAFTNTTRGYARNSYGSINTALANLVPIISIIYFEINTKGTIGRNFAVNLEGIYPQGLFSTISSPQGLNPLLTTAASQFTQNSSQNITTWRWTLNYTPVPFSSTGATIDLIII